MPNTPPPGEEPPRCYWCEEPIRGEPFDEPFLRMVFGYVYCSKECRDAHVFSK
jgi:hypothetical protein